MPDEKFLKYRAKILAVNTGDQPDRLTHNITVPTFRGYQAGDVIPAGTLLRDIIEKEFNSTPPAPKVTIIVSGVGSTDPAAGAHNVAYGGDFTFNSATPGAGYRLRGIVVDGESRTAPFTLRNITADKNITVTFEEIPPTPTFTITASVTGNGTISPSGNIPVEEGSSQTFTITPNSGYQIKDVKVDGASVGAVPSYTFNNVTSAHTIDAEFEEIPAVTHTIRATAGEGGGISPYGDVVVADGASQTFNIMVESGYEIDEVTVDGVSQGAISSYTFTNVVADHTISVTFIQPVTPPHTIVASAGAGGSISPSGNVSVMHGDSQVFTITANSGYVIDSVSVDGASQGAIATYTFSNVVADHTINATFRAVPVTYTVEGTTSGGYASHGTVTPASTTVEAGGNVTFTCTCDAGYEVDEWSVGGVTKQTGGSTYTLTNVTTNTTVRATLKQTPVEVYHVVIADATDPSLTGAGTINPAVGSHDVNVGSSQAVVATPASGFKIKSFKVDSTEQSISDPTQAFTYTVSGVAADATVNIIVEFERIPSGNIYTQAYTPGNGRVWQEPTAEIIVTGDPLADPDTAVTQLKAGTYAWKSKLQSRSAETFLIAKSLARITSIKANGTDEVLDHNVFDEKTITLDGVDYWCYYNKGLGGGGNNYVMKGE